MERIGKIRMAENAEVLNEEEMKQVLGGYEYATSCRIGGSFSSSCSGTCEVWRENQFVMRGECRTMSAYFDNTCYCI